MRVLSLAVPAILAAAAACSRSPEPERACTLIGCESGLEVQVRGAPTGAFRVEASAPGDAAPRVFECPAGGRCERAFFADFTPESAIIRVIAAGDTVTRSVRPTYETVQPNGPGCPPICRQANVRVDFDRQ